jgi:tetratricopeptide (TPR) repeat protein
MIGHIMQAHLEIASGKWNHGMDRLRNSLSYNTNSNPTALEFEILFSLMPFYPASDSLLAMLRNRLTDTIGTVDINKPWEYNYFTPHDPLHFYIHLYLIGMINARLVQYEDALQYAGKLDKSRMYEFMHAMPGNFSKRIQSEVYRLQNKPAEALAALHGTENGVPFVLITNSPLFSQPYERYIRGELYYQLGRYEDALAWYYSIEGISVFDAPYLAPSYLRRAQIYEELGESRKAEKYYSLFVDLWKECDPELAYHVEEAKEKLKRFTIIE